jgi:hypothetical protein
MDPILDLVEALRRAANALEKFDLTPPAPMYGPELRRLLNTKDAGTYLGVSGRTVQKLSLAGEIARVNIGHRVLYDVMELDRYADDLALQR